MASVGTFIFEERVCFCGSLFQNLSWSLGFWLGHISDLTLSFVAVLLSRGVLQQKPVGVVLIYFFFFSLEARARNQFEPLAISQNGYCANENLEHHCKLECLAAARISLCLFMRYIKRSVLLYRFLALAVFSFFMIYFFLFSNSRDILFWICNVAFLIGWCIAGKKHCISKFQTHFDCFIRKTLLRG